jgi:hypothetical protein
MMVEKQAGSATRDSIKKFAALLSS